jgi:hypothetical protein
MLEESLALVESMLEEFGVPSRHKQVPHGRRRIVAVHSRA